MKISELITMLDQIGRTENTDLDVIIMNEGSEWYGGAHLDTESVEVTTLDGGLTKKLAIRFDRPGTFIY